MTRFALVLLSVALAAQARPLRAADIDACGTLTLGVPGSGCADLALHLDGLGYFSLDTYGTFVAGDAVHVRGSYPSFCWAPCPDFDGCLQVETIELCLPVATDTRTWGTIKALYP